MKVFNFFIITLIGISAGYPAPSNTGLPANSNHDPNRATNSNISFRTFMDSLMAPNLDHPAAQKYPTNNFMDNLAALTRAVGTDTAEALAVSTRAFSPRSKPVPNATDVNVPHETLKDNLHNEAVPMARQMAPSSENSQDELPPKEEQPINGDEPDVKLRSELDTELTPAPDLEPTVAPSQEPMAREFDPQTTVADNELPSAEVAARAIENQSELDIPSSNQDLGEHVTVVDKEPIERGIDFLTDLTANTKVLVKNILARSNDLISRDYPIQNLPKNLPRMSTGNGDGLLENDNLSLRGAEDNIISDTKAQEVELSRQLDDQPIEEEKVHKTDTTGAVNDVKINQEDPSLRSGLYDIEDGHTDFIEPVVPRISTESDGAEAASARSFVDVQPVLPSPISPHPVGGFPAPVRRVSPFYGLSRFMNPYNLGYMPSASPIDYSSYGTQPFSGHYPSDLLSYLYGTSPMLQYGNYGKSFHNKK